MTAPFVLQEVDRMFTQYHESTKNQLKDLSGDKTT